MKRSKVGRIVDAALEGAKLADGTLAAPPLLVVEWHDTFAETERSWSSHEDMVELSSEPMLVESVGFFRHMNDYHIVLVTNQSHKNGMHFGEVHIPFGMIQKVRVV